MNSKGWLAVLSALIIVCTAASALWLSHSVSALSNDVTSLSHEISRLQEGINLQTEEARVPAAVGIRNADVVPNGEIPVDPLAGVDVKRASDIQARVDAMVDTWKSQVRGEIAQIEDLAAVLTEINDWVFLPEEQAKADRITAAEISLLRRMIAAQVTKLSGAAVAAGNGKQATEMMGQINRLLSLYPAPATTAEQTALDQITSNILHTSRRVEEIRYLRYNQWAISQIEVGLKRYRDESAIGAMQDLSKLVSRDRQRLRAAAITTLAKIDTIFLSPSSMDLYNYVYTLYRDAMGSDDAARTALAKGLADPAIERQTPTDF